ncbi:MAG: hypothetical protein IPN29_06170 [Saprospiraceae bacterium]|nr:hypothetical protein [Saprospiraceae bacterium]
MDTTRASLPYSFSENILSGGGDGILCWWDIDKQSIIHTLALSHQSLRCISKSIRGDHIFVGSSDGNIYEVDARQGTLIRSIHAHDMSVFALCIDHDVLFSGGRDALLKAWPLSGDEGSFSIVAHMGTINDITLHDEFVVTASRDKNLRIWEKSGKLVQSLSPILGGHFHSVNAVKSLSDSNFMASASDDKSIILWGEN